MPRYFFHLSAPDVSFRDPIGFELSDLSAAHSRALQLADRVMMIGGLASCPPDLRRWTVQIADEWQHSVMTVMFSAASENGGLPTMLTEPAHRKNALRHGGIKKHLSLDQNSSQSIQ